MVLDTFPGPAAAAIPALSNPGIDTILQHSIQYNNRSGSSFYPSLASNSSLGSSTEGKEDATAKMTIANIARFDMI